MVEWFGLPLGFATAEQCSCLRNKVLPFARQVVNYRLHTADSSVAPAQLTLTDMPAADKPQARRRDEAA